MTDSNIKSHKKNFLTHVKAFFPAFAWAVLIYVFSAQKVLPGLSLSLPDFLLKKTAHITVYAVFYYLLIHGFSKINYRFDQIWFKAFLICVAYAALDELHQSTVPGRTATVTDVGFDSLGAGLVILRKFGMI